MRPIATLEVPLTAIRPLMRLTGKPELSLAHVARELDATAAVPGRPHAGTIGLADYFRILERLAMSAHDETWGLSRRPLLPGATGLVLSSLSGCTTFLQAARSVARTYNLLHGGSYNRVELHGDRLAYIIDDGNFPYAPGMDPTQKQFTMVSVLIFLHGLLVLIAGDTLHERVTKVHIKGSRLGASHGYLGFWPAPVRWSSSRYALDYEAEVSSLPVAHGGPIPALQTIYRKIIDLIERDPYGRTRPRTTSERVLEALELNVFDQSAVAKRLGLSVATLRRRLQMEKGSASYRALSENVRERAAKSLLEQHHHATDVAEELGYSDQRSFARAFKRWTGMTPAAYTTLGSAPISPSAGPTVNRHRSHTMRRAPGRQC